MGGQKGGLDLGFLYFGGFFTCWGHARQPLQGWAERDACLSPPDAAASSHQHCWLLTAMKPRSTLLPWGESPHCGSARGETSSSFPSPGRG